MNIQAADVKKLRDITGAGMMDCKKALIECGGDFKQAEKKLKELGLAAAAKRSHKATDNGRIATRASGSKAGILELYCETDFVSRNKDFVELAGTLLEDVLKNGYTDINEPALVDQVSDITARIKENMGLKRFTVLDVAENEYVAQYIHGEGSIGVLVKISTDKPEILADEEVQAVAFDLALHTAFHNPPYLDKGQVDQGYLDEQEDIYRKQTEALGKPPQVIDNIVKGKIQKHFSEICFLQQPFVKDDKRSVEQVLADLGKAKGGSLQLVDYVYYRVGEEA